MDLIAFLVLMLPGHRAHLLTRLSCSSLPRLCSYPFETVDDDANGQVGRSPRSIQGPVLPVKMETPIAFALAPILFHCTPRSHPSALILHRGAGSSQSLPPLTVPLCIVIDRSTPLAFVASCSRHDTTRQERVWSHRPVARFRWFGLLPFLRPPLQSHLYLFTRLKGPASSSQQRDRTPQNVLCSVLQTPRASTAIRRAGGGKRSSTRLSQIECRAGRR